MRSKFLKIMVIIGVLVIIGCIAFYIGSFMKSNRQNDLSEAFVMKGTVIQMNDNSMLVEPIAGS